jgi:hypothetical protein
VKLFELPAHFVLQPYNRITFTALLPRSLPVVGFCCADTAVITSVIRRKAVFRTAERRPEAFV